MTPDFVWGAATSAFQIEGAFSDRGRSIWDDFCDQPGRIANADRADVACDHVHRYREDVANLAWLGANAYRFSVAWPRVLRDGEPNPAGIGFYDRLIDECLAQGIDPWLTAYHWDLPSELQAKGGWINRDSTEWFADYFTLLVQRYGDRVKHWITINEPHCTSWFGHYLGWFAPGLTGIENGVASAHHQLLAHGRAVQRLREMLPQAKVGIAPGLTPSVPASDSREDRAAAIRQDGYEIRWFLDPLYGKGYPADMVELLGVNPPVHDGDLAEIAAPTDFLAVNYYLQQTIAANMGAAPLFTEGIDSPEVSRTDMGWEIWPSGLRDVLLRVNSDYAPNAIYITENGSAWDDILAADGKVHDDGRTEYLLRHLDAVAAAKSAGVPVHGYFAWSLLDNFEWTQGFSRRFGLFYVDFETQRRVAKDSAYAFRDYIRAQRGSND